jgi:hypothetical protein
MIKERKKINILYFFYKNRLLSSVINTPGSYSSSFLFSSSLFFVSLPPERPNERDTERERELRWERMGVRDEIRE